jgi:tetratricopeptide (TPR) repeat protein
MYLLLLLAQVTAPPEFQSTATFQTSAGAATVDGTTHTAAEQARIDGEIVRRLKALAGHEEGARLIDAKLYGAAEAVFRKRGQVAGVAVALYLNGKTAAATEALLAAPRSLALLPFLAEMGEGPAVAGAIREIAAANPSSGEALYYAARVTEPRGEAVRLLEKAAALDGKDTRALLELARLHGDDRPKAIAALEGVLARDPAMAAAHYRLASLYRAVGDVEKSRMHMEAFRKSQPR